MLTVEMILALPDCERLSSLEDCLPKERKLTVPRLDWTFANAVNQRRANDCSWHF